MEVNKIFLEWHPTYYTNLLSPGLVWYVWHVSKGISFFSAILGGVSGGDKSVQGQSKRPISGTHQGREGVHSCFWESPASSFRQWHISAPIAPTACSGSTRRGKTSPIFLMVSFSSSLRAAMPSPSNVHRQKGWLAPSGCHLNTSLLSAEEGTPWDKNPLHLKGLQCLSMTITCDVWVKAFITCAQQGSMDIDITSVTAQMK